MGKSDWVRGGWKDYKPADFSGDRRRKPSEDPLSISYEEKSRSKFKPRLPEAVARWAHINHQYDLPQKERDP